MPLRLKSLELHGYKTFASRSAFEFPGMITAIVGPNGSGKSNITDGLRWVLGEQSYGLLRGKKTEDMIFAGSEGRPRAGMASATIHFDNSEGWLPIDYSEVAITRRAYRDGQNEYLLNGQRVRLRDIGELLSQSGLSERTFTIIGQGLVDASLALRPEERRKLFEEAAGIGLYRSRREESLNRLEATHRNIERVQDIILELEPRLTTLEKQAKKALEYERIKADLKMTLREWYGYHWFKSQQDLALQHETLKQQEKIVEAARSKYDTHNHSMISIRQTVQELRQQLNGWHNQASTYHNEKELISREIAVIDERQRSLNDQTSNLDVEKARLTQELDSTRQVLEDLNVERENLAAELESAGEKSSEIKRKLDALLENKNKHESLLADYRNRISRLENSVVQLNLQVEERNNRKKTISGSNDRLQSAIDETSEQVNTFTVEQKKVNQEKDQLEQESQKINSDIEEIRKNISTSIQDLSELRSKKAKLQGEISRITIEIDVIHEAEKNLTGYSTGAKHLLTMIRKGDIQGLSNALSGELVIPEAYESAITAALGEFMDAIIIQKESDVDSALTSLQGIQNARSTLFHAGEVEPEQRKITTKVAGCVGNALDLIQYPDRIRPFLEVVLGQTVIVENRQNARAVLKNLPAGARAVTLDGEIFYRSGVIIGGKQSSSARISRPRQLQDLEVDLSKRKAELTEMDEQIHQIEAKRKEAEDKIQRLDHSSAEVHSQLRQVNSRLQQVSINLEKSKRQLEWNHTQQIQLETEEIQIDREIGAAKEKIKVSQVELKTLSEEFQKVQTDANYEDIDPLRSEYNYHQTSLAVNQRALNDLQKRIQEKIEFIKQNELSIQRNLERTNQINTSLKTLEDSRIEKKNQEEEKTAALHQLQESIEPAEIELERLETNFNQMQELENNHQVALTNAEKHLTQAQMDLNHKRDNLEVLRRRVEEDFGLVAFEYSENQSGPTPLPIEGMVEELPRVEKLSPELEESLSRQKAMLRRMGSVNPEAQAEYQTTKERHDFLKSQIADLFKAEEDLKKILQDLDELMRLEFTKTFEQVSVEFPKMFNRLFGGGGARLSLTDPDNIHDTGIDIHARLPGKREQELTLLSGGERSLTAVALIFALLKISPTPFCVLDEVDAALDETNVGRFRDLLEELSQEIQFILVTHNRNTVQAANVIYGITMGRDSTSQAISLRLDEVSDDMLSRG